MNKFSCIFRRKKLHEIGSRILWLKSKFLPLKWWFVFVGYGIALAAVGVCFYCIVVYGAILGETLVTQWLIAFVIGIVKDAFVLDPVKVWNILISTVLKSENILKTICSMIQ